MVNFSNFLCGILAYRLIGPCLAADNATMGLFASSVLLAYDNEALDMTDTEKANITITSCALIYSTELNGETFNGYVYEAKVTGINCDNTLGKENVLAAVEKCADKLSKHDAPRGCCPFTHGGTWSGHLRLSAEPSFYPVREIDC